MIATRSARWGFTIAASLLLACAALGGTLAPAAEKFPNHQREFFSDFTGKLDDKERLAVDEKLKEASHASGIHAVLVIVTKMAEYPDMPQTPKEFALEVAKTWKVGNAKNGKGILVFFSVQDRKFQVVKTKNLPLSLTEQIAGSMKGKVTLALSDGEYGDAMKAAADNIARFLPGDPSRPATASGGPSSGTPVSAHSSNSSRSAPAQYDAHSRSSSGFGGWIVLIIAGVIGFIILIAIISAFSGRGAYSPGYAPSYGGGYYQPGYGGGYYGGGGGGFFTGMMVGGMMNGMFGGGGGRTVEHHYHDSGSTSTGFFGGSVGGGGDSSGGSWGDVGASFGGGGGFESFGGGSFDGGSSGGEW